jgi:hypothetical protein
VFQIVTMDFWEDVYDRVLMSNGAGYLAIFVVFVFLGSFYLKNLVLAVVALNYDETCEKNRRELIEAEAYRKQVRLEERRQEVWYAFLTEIHARGCFEFHVFALLETLPCVWPTAFISGVHSSYLYRLTL